jgi:hypothetical protein
VNKVAASELRVYQDGVTRPIEIPGIGAEAAQEIIAEIGSEAAAFGDLPEWFCPPLSLEPGRFSRRIRGLQSDRHSDGRSSGHGGARSKMNPKLRAPLVLREIEGLSHEEIPEIRASPIAYGMEGGMR